VADTTHGEPMSQIANLRDVMDERDRRYTDRFDAQDKAVEAALLAQKSAVDAALVSSDKAVAKAEEAQKEYNIRSNEFRAALDDAGKLNITRNEVGVLIKASEDRDSALQAQITELRLSKATLEGKASQNAVNISLLFAIVGLLLSVLALVLSQ
jgi:hypothetical protein